MTRKPKEKWLTRKSARVAAACYSDKRLASLIPARGMSIERVAKLKIPEADRAWALRQACNWPEARHIWLAAKSKTFTALKQGGFEGDTYQAAGTVADRHLIAVAHGHTGIVR